MKFYIKIVDGQPFEHPIIEANFKLAYPEIEMENLPSDFAVFIQVEEPHLDPYEVCEGCSYVWDGDRVTQTHHCRAMTEDEAQEYDSLMADLFEQPTPPET
tara:strand:- start:64 stop:366 length:303 start_codon:yes stop_codon:yes gene_type:complete